LWIWLSRVQIPSATPPFQALATDACSAFVNIAQQPFAGTEIPAGTNTFVFYVDDGNGSTNTC
jgi:hypothetical protein